MANFAFNIMKSQLMQGDLDLENDVLRMGLLKTMSTDENTLADYDDLDAFLGDSGVEEADADDYGRVTIANPAVSTNDGDERGELTFDNVIFTNLGHDGGGSVNNTIVAAFLYKQIGGDDTTPGDDIVLGVYDINDTETNGEDFELSVGSDGALHVT